MTTDGPATNARPQTDQRGLDRALIRGVAWTGAFRWLTQLLNWGITIALARILSPSDYGLYGYAALYVGLVQLVNEFGLGAAIVRRRDLTDHQISALGGLSLVLGLVLFGLSFLTAPLVAAFFRAPDLRWPLVLLSGLFITTAIKVLPKSLLSRDLQFRRVAAIDAIEAGLQGIATLVLALLGFRFWALMAGMVIGAVASSALAVYWRRHRLGWPRSWEEISAPVAFGSHIMVTRLAWFGYSNGDNAVVGKRLGQALLGAYTHAWTLASLPVDRISGLVGQVTPAIFSAVQHDLPSLRRYLLKVTEGLALLTFPVAFGLASVSDLFVTVVLGDQWWPAIAPLALLTFYGGLRSITTPYPHLLQAVGESGLAMRLNLMGLAVLLPLFYIGSFWGLAGVAAGWIIGYPVLSMVTFRAVQRVSGLGLGEYLEAVRPPLIASVAMGAAVIGVRAALPAAWSDALHLIIAVAAGVAVYPIVMLVAFRDRLNSLRALAREIRR
ncbi:MAG: lipopolysaccharide biosynthesis protein [Gemmatimonadota bacterium]|nr:lipopolysaccharide biosynthesis protein [Gemmatimonadota bacterium]